MDNIFYILERAYRNEQPYRLSTYALDKDKKKLKRLDSLTLETTRFGSRGVWWPRSDPRERCVYLPCEGDGLMVLRWEGGRVVKTKTLTCVTSAVSVAVMSSRCLYVGDGQNRDVCVIDVLQDRITDRLSVPKGFEGKYPLRLTSLGDNVLVGYEYIPAFDGPPFGRLSQYLDTLVLYKHPSRVPVRVVHPEGLKHMEGIGSDKHSKFLMVDRFTHLVFVLDAKGAVSRKVFIPGDKVLMDSAVADGKLWLACEAGEIIAMSSVTSQLTSCL